MDTSEGGSGEAAPPGTRPLNELFRQLSHPVRRRVLADLVAADPGEELTSEDLTAGPGVDDRELIELYHVHLPKLAVAGYVEWDRECDVVARGPRFEAVRSAVELLAGHDDRLLEGRV